MRPLLDCGVSWADGSGTIRLFCIPSIGGAIGSYRWCSLHWEYTFLVSVGHFPDGSFLYDFLTNFLLYFYGFPNSINNGTEAASDQTGMIDFPSRGVRVR